MATIGVALCLVATFGFAACGPFDNDDGSASERALDMANDLAELNGEMAAVSASVEPSPRELEEAREKLLELRSDALALRTRIGEDLPAALSGREALIAAAGLSAAFAGDEAALLGSLAKVLRRLERAAKVAVRELTRLRQQIAEFLERLRGLVRQFARALNRLADALRALGRAFAEAADQIDELLKGLLRSRRTASRALQALADDTQREVKEVAPAAPTGPLGTSSIGRVKVGMSPDEVERLIGRPDRKQEVNLGQGPTPQIDWIWNYPDGSLRLQFDTATNELSGYSCDTGKFSTDFGTKVGDPFAPVRERFGDRLTEGPFGVGTYVLSEGEPGSFPALHFSVEGGTITSISGGKLQPAGE